MNHAIIDPQRASLNGINTPGALVCPNKAAGMDLGKFKRTAWVGLMAVILSGCSVVQSLYNNAPQLVYWWLDDYVDFRQDQKDWVKIRLSDLLVWHRSSQLPIYLEQVKKLTDLAQGEITPEVGCGLVQTLLDTQNAWLDQMSPPLSIFLSSMSQRQVQHLQEAFARKNKDWSKEWLEVSDQDRLAHQADKGIEQAQDLYGKLSASQKGALRQLAKESGYDAQKSLGLRHARQQQTLQTVEQLRQMAKTPGKGSSLVQPSDAPLAEPYAPAAVALVRDGLEKMLQPLDPDLRDYNTRRWNMNCQSSSRFHALTTPEQRQHAKLRLKRYAQDFQALLATAP